MDHFVPTEDVNALYGLLGEMNPKHAGHWPQVAVEIGAWAGRTTLLLDSFSLHTFAVDHWQGSPEDRMEALAKQYTPRGAFQTFCRNMGDKLHRSVFPCVGHSATWAAIWQRPIDFLYIDGDHRYKAVMADIDGWMPHVRPGGIIAGHDYHLPGVHNAVHAFWPSQQIKTCGANIWYVEVPDAK